MKRTGSALLAVLFMIAGISLLLLRLHYCTHLLVETVIQREQQAQWYYATQACMRYAIILAKHNWFNIHKKAKHKQMVYTIAWPITPDISGSSTIEFISLQNDIRVNVYMHDGIELKQALSCVLLPVYSEKNDQGKGVSHVTITAWQEHA